MDDRETENELDALRRIRTQLTVALLAVGRLCRAVGSLPPVERLCGLATAALLHVRDEVTGIETRLIHRIQRATPPSNPASEQPPGS